jgi:hypothetical protein
MIEITKKQIEVDVETSYCDKCRRRLNDLEDKVTWDYFVIGASKRRKVDLVPDNVFVCLPCMKEFLGRSSWEEQ